jgi:hypothetical protein
MIEMVEIKQTFPNEEVKDVKEAVEREIKQNLPIHSLRKGAEIAVTAGSRGISNIVEILKETVSVLKELGFSPFLIPAMGSHGGATAEGQIEVLKHLRITEEVVGAEIRSSMETELLGHTPEGNPVYMDKNALNTDGIIVINRVKAHTAFQGMVESGLSKMVMIGLGKKKGASFVHSDGALKMADNIINGSKFAIEHSPILMGLAIIENGYDETADIVGVGKDEWHQKEAELLKRSKSMMPSLPIEHIDLLIVEEMGKCFSGTGMDPNIIGRWRIDGVDEPKTPSVARLAVLDLAERSFGNAQGIGLADFTTQRLVDKIDRNSTYTNAITATFLKRAMLPMIYDSDKEAIETAIHSLGPDVDVDKLKIVQVPNTLHLGRVVVSKPVIYEMKKANRTFEEVNTHLLMFNEKDGDLSTKLTVPTT